MTTAKLIDNNRRSHAAKVLAQASKKNQTEHHTETTAEMSSETTESENDVFSTLTEQYGVIREDILKLREDLAHGYDLLKEYAETKLSVKSLLRLRF